MSQIERVCVICGQSCAGQARIKDTKGNYAHKACVEQKQTGQDHAAEQDALHADDGLGGGMDDLWEDLEPIEPEAVAAASGCPGCGLRMEPGAVVCMNCGFDTQSGKGLKTRTFDAKPKKAKPGAGSDESKIAELGAGIVGLGMKPIFPLIGALIGGAIGAAIWATIAYTTGYEIGYIAILVGGLCGAGARIGGGAETTGGGMIAGLLAAGMALLSIGMGKYVALNMIIDRDYGGNIFQMQPMNLYDMEETDVLRHMAFVECARRIDAGEVIEWPDPALPIDVAEWPDDYPESVYERVIDAWDEMGDSGQLRMRRDIAQGSGLHSYRDVDEKWALQVLADEIAWGMIEAEEPIEWPSQHLFNESALWPDDYPESIREEVETQWATLSPEDRDMKRQAAVDAYNDLLVEVDQVMDDITFQAVLESFKRPRHILSLLFGLWIAYRLGNNDD